jgi:hypothetical protein
LASKICKNISNIIIAMMEIPYTTKAITAITAMKL